MAIFYFNARAISRSSGGNACKSGAYNAREEITDERTGKIYNYSERTDLAHSLIMTPNVNGQSFKIDRSRLWNLVESTEHRADSQLARSIVLALPTEIDHQAKWLLTQKFIRDNFISQGMIADVNVHDIDGHNPHVHILLTMRDINEITLSGEVIFGLKNRTWNDKKLLDQQKECWAKTVNKYLELAQVPDRIDHRSLAEQGIERIPQIHIGETAWNMEKRGIQTERGDLHRQIAETNRNIELLRNTAVAVQQSLEIELRLEVQRREQAQRKQARRKAEREDRRQQSPINKDPEPEPQAEVQLPEIVTPVDLMHSYAALEQVAREQAELKRLERPKRQKKSEAVLIPTQGGSIKPDNQETELEKVEPTKESQAITLKLRTDRDIIPTIGELREAYLKKLTHGDKVGLSQIEKAGTELNNIYHQNYPDQEKAPDNFKHQDIWIDRKLLDIQTKSQTKNRGKNQDFGMSI
jgi:hypothetical protein